MINPWRVLCVAFGGVVLLLSLQILSKEVDRRTAEVLAKNPKRMERSYSHRVEGRVKIREIVVERLGERRIEREEVHEPVVIEERQSLDVSPVPLDVLLRKPGQRWVLGVWGDPASARLQGFRGLGIAAGVSFLNRLDAVYLIGRDEDAHLKGRAVLLWHF